VAVIDLAAAIENDWQYMHGVQDVEYFSRVSETTYLAATTVKALKRMNQKGMAVGDELVGVSMNEVPWEVWKATFETPTIPKIGDKFVATGVSGSKTWNVLKVDYCTLGTRYRLHCKQEGDNS